MKIVGQVEIDEYCQKILKKRWPKVPKRRNIKRVKGHVMLRECGPIELISGGFPCQPFSVAGKRKGAADDRNLWPEMFRIISEVRPAWVLAENVFGVLGFVESVVLPDLESAGYEALSLCFPAHALGAPHRRDRVWIIAYSPSERRRLSKIKESRRPETSEFVDDGEKKSLADPNSKRDKRINRNHSSTSSAGKGEGIRIWSKYRDQAGDGSKDLADAPCERGQRRRFSKPGKISKPSNGGQNVCHAASKRLYAGALAGVHRGEKSAGTRHEQFKRSNWWTVEPGVGRVAHGTPNRVDRLKLLGNGQVVQVVQWIGEKIMEFQFAK